MEFEQYHEADKHKFVIVIRITKEEYTKFESEYFDLKLVENLQKSKKISDKLQALRIIAKKLEEGGN